METKQSALGLTGNVLKMIALLTMTVDHIGFMLFPNVAVLRIIGRLAMPIFAWMIAEGCTYTKNRVRYFFMIFGVGLLCQAVYLLFMESLDQCILITFSMSVLLIYVMDLAVRKKNFLTLCLMGAVFTGACYICVFLPGDLPNTDFRIDYGIWGVLLPVVIYIAKTKEEKLLAAAGVLAMLAIRSGYVQWFALLALPLIALYNGRRGNGNLKYLFYFYYPLHLAAIYGISLLMQ